MDTQVVDTRFSLDESVEAGAAPRLGRCLKRTALATLIAAGALVSGCSGSDPVTAGQSEGPLLPFAVGNTWTYQVTEDGVVSTKTTTILERTPVGGEGYNKDRMAFHVITRKGLDEKDKTESWQDVLPEAPDTVVRFREVSYGAMTGLAQLDESWDKYKLRISGEKIKSVVEANGAGPSATWLEEYREIRFDHRVSPPSRVESEQFDPWTVVDDDVEVTVGAIKYPHAVHLSKLSGNGSGDNKEYWFVRGIGKVKEVGGLTEELIDYSVQAP